MKSKQLRYFEQNVLDVAYMNHDVWQYDKGNVIYALYAAFDSMLLPFLEVNPTETGPLQWFKSIEEGFVQAVNWFNAKYGNVAPQPTSRTEIIAAAGDFLLFSARYALVAHFHVKFGKGLCQVEIDEKTKTITFIPNSDKYQDGGGFSQGAHVEQSYIKSTRSNANPEDVRSALEAVKLSLIKGRIVFNDYSFLCDESLRSASSGSTRVEKLYLPEQITLSIFSFKDYEAIMSVLETWSFVATMLYTALCSQGSVQSECMPTQVIQLDKLVSVLAVYSNVHIDTIRKVIVFLSYGSRTKNDVFLQPFYLKDGLCMWSPFLVGKTKYKRNLLKLMSRTPDLAKEVATIIGSRELLVLNDVGLYFSKKGGYAFKINKEIRSKIGSGEIDILLYTQRAPTEVLIIEAKCVLSVDDFNEVYSATKEMIKAQGQIRNVFKILEDMSLSDKKTLYPFVKWEQVNQFYGLVVSPDSYPSSNYSHEDIPATTIQIMKHHLTAKDLKKPSTICNAFRVRAWAPKQLSLQIEYEENEIGGIVYRIPMTELE